MAKNESILPAGWTWSKIKDVVSKPKIDIVDGPFGSNLKSSEYVDFGIPIIRIQNVERNKFINKNIHYVTKKKADQLKRHSFSKNDIIITKLGVPVGKACLVPEYLEKGIIVADILRMKVLDEFVSRKFLMFLINSDIIKKQFASQTSGTTRPRVNLTKFREFDIPVPPLNEQKRIVSKIEELSSQINQTVNSLKIIIKQLNRFRNSLLINAFSGKLTESWRKNHPELNVELLIKNIEKQHKKENLDIAKHIEMINPYSIPKNWKWVVVNEIEKFIGSGITPRGGKSNYYDSGIPFIRSQNVYQNGLRLDDIVYITKEQHSKMSRTHIQDKDVLLNITGASIGRSTYVPEGFGEGNVNQHVCIIRTYSDISSSYVSAWLNSPEGQHQIFSTQKGQTREGLNYSQIRSILIPLCSREEQIEIINIIEKNLTNTFFIEKLIKQRLVELENLRNSILKNTFEGKLVSQDPNDEPAAELLKKIKISVKN